MFLNEKALEKLIKQAYKGNGVTIGNITVQGADVAVEDKEGIFFTNGYWMAWLSINCLTNKTKSIIAELAGDLPYKNKIFRISTTDSDPQMYIDDQYEKILNEAKRKQNKYKVTNILLEDDLQVLRLLQNERNNKKVWIPDRYYRVLDFTQIDFEFESKPVSAVSGENYEESGLIYWYNETCIYIICSYKTKSGITELLQQVDFKSLENHEEE